MEFSDVIRPWSGGFHGIVNIRFKIEGFRAWPEPVDTLVLTHPISLKQPNIQKNHLSSLVTVLAKTLNSSSLKSP